jgi:hypothetical protein
MARDERAKEAAATTRNRKCGIDVPAIVNPKAGF